MRLVSDGGQVVDVCIDGEVGPPTSAFGAPDVRSGLGQGAARRRCERDDLDAKVIEGSQEAMQAALIDDPSHHVGPTIVDVNDIESSQRTDEGWTQPPFDNNLEAFAFHDACNRSGVRPVMPKIFRAIGDGLNTTKEPPEALRALQCWTNTDRPAESRNVTSAKSISTSAVPCNA
jgi:hypothetical protein